MRFEYSNFKFDVAFHERKGYYAHAHCEFCNSSFGTGEYKKKKLDAVESAIDDLLVHLNCCNIKKEQSASFVEIENRYDQKNARSS